MPEIDDVTRQLYGLLAVAEEQQKAIENAAKALASERENLARERALISGTIDEEMSAATKKLLSASSASTRELQRIAASISMRMIALIAVAAAVVVAIAFVALAYQRSRYSELSAEISQLIEQQRTIIEIESSKRARSR